MENKGCLCSQLWSKFINNQTKIPFLDNLQIFWKENQDNEEQYLQEMRMGL